MIIEDELLRDKNFRALSSGAKVIYIYLRSKIVPKSKNPLVVVFPYKEVSDIMSYDAANRALKELIKYRWINKTKGNWNDGYSLYVITKKYEKLLEINQNNEPPEVRELSDNAKKVYFYIKNKLENNVIKEVVLTYEEIENINGMIAKKAVSKALKELVVLGFIQSEFYKEENKKGRELKRSGYVYLIKADNGKYKIGKANNYKIRLDTFDVKLPYDVELVHLIKTRDAFEMESKLHKIYKNSRIRGEWFNLTKKQVVEIGTYAK